MRFGFGFGFSQPSEKRGRHKSPHLALRAVYCTAVLRCAECIHLRSTDKRTGDVKYRVSVMVSS